jgi:hypothetical protein
MRKWTMWATTLALAASSHAADLTTDWAYHDGNDGTDNRVTENIPGEGYAFIGNGTLSVGNDDPVTLYVLTSNNFAGDKDEQIFVRWWNGESENWVMGGWEKNIYLGKNGETDNGVFHGQPSEGGVMLDLWKIVIPPEMTRPGENFYVIQLKGFQEGSEPTQVYLLRDGADGSSNNNLGQAWTSGDYFGHDWSVTISE